MDGIAKLVSEFHQQYPDVKFHTYSGDADAVLDCIDKGLPDMGLLLGPVRQEKYDYLKLHQKDIYGLRLPKDCQLAQQTVINIDQLKTLPIILADQTFWGHHSSLFIQKRGKDKLTIFEIWGHDHPFAAAARGRSFIFESCVAKSDRPIALPGLVPLGGAVYNGSWKQGKKLIRSSAMRILMLGNSFIFTNHMPQMLADLTGAEGTHHTRGGARLSEQLNPCTRLGGRTQAALQTEKWDYVVLQKMSHGPITAPKSFFSSVGQLCRQIRANGAVPILFAAWAYQRSGAKLTDKGWDYDEMARTLSEAYHRAARDNNALIADVGRRFYEWSDPQALYAADGVRPSELGSHIAAETIAAVIRQWEEGLR